MPLLFPGPTLPSRMVALYAFTIFTSSALLFLVQPMFARMVLPLLGGSPAVWNTAMVFYQTILLAGYAYAHISTTRLGVRRQAGWQIPLLFAPLLVLPLVVPGGWTPPTETNPIPWLLALMTVAVGLPLFAVSTMSPLIQKWFAATGHHRSADPYFLYAASNAGSMLGLLCYPLWLEPRFRLEQQSRFWMWGYWLLVALAIGCVICLRRASAQLPAGSSPASSVETDTAPKITSARRFRWVLLSFVPSSLMLGVTSYLSSDIAVIPLMWVLPLSIYLLTFILAFARRQILSSSLLARVWPLALVPLVIAFSVQAALPMWSLLVLHLGAFFVAALFCHTELAADRPSATHLTEFFLWMSIGGVLGGVFNALVAPLVFNSVVEYPITVVLVCLIGWKAGPEGRFPRLQIADWLWPLLLGAFAFALGFAINASPLKHSNAIGYLGFGLPVLLCYFLSRHALRFALGVAAIMLAGSFYQGDKGQILEAERSFFGVHRVAVSHSGKYHALLHGVTNHGMQSLDPARRRESLSYFHRTGPVGEVLAAYGRDPQKKIAVVGLGAVSLASFAQSGQSWTYYEIDPVVLKLATDPRFFTFLQDSPAQMRVVMGDARLSLAKTEEKFDVLILDAYSSDAIPVHLVTREALALYFERLAPHGILTFHISNLHLDLEPVFANLARDANVVCLTRDDTTISPEEQAQGKSPSIWIVIGRNTADVSRLVNDPRWKPSRQDESQAVWTDDYSSLVSVLRRR
jgi:hypothetical protein